MEGSELKGISEMIGNSGAISGYVVMSGSRMKGGWSGLSTEQVGGRVAA